MPSPSLVRLEYHHRPLAVSLGTVAVLDKVLPLLYVWISGSPDLPVTGVESISTCMPAVKGICDNDKK